MGVKVTMDSGAAYVAHEARTDGTHNGGHPIRYRQTFAEMGRMTAIYSRDAR